MSFQLPVNYQKNSLHLHTPSNRSTPVVTNVPIRIISSSSECKRPFDDQLRNIEPVSLIHASDHVLALPLDESPRAGKNIIHSTGIQNINLMPLPSSASVSQNGTLPRNEPIRVAQRPPPSCHLRQTSSISSHHRFVAAAPSTSGLVDNNNGENVVDHQRLSTSQSMTTFPAMRPTSKGHSPSSLSQASSSQRLQNGHSFAQNFSYSKLLPQAPSRSFSSKTFQQQKPVGLTSNMEGGPKQQNGLPNTSLSNGTSAAEVEMTPAKQQRLVRMSYADILEHARNQQKQIEANDAQLDERRRLIASLGTTRKTAGSNGKFDQQSAKIQISGLRAQIAKDEFELAKLSSLQRDTQQLSSHNHRQYNELKQLEEAYSRDDGLLRKAVERVDVLRKQLDQFYERRAASAKAAADASQQHDKSDNCLSSFGSSGNKNGTQSNSQIQNRPKASVEPFRHQNFEVKTEPVLWNDTNGRSHPPSNTYVGRRVPYQERNGESVHFRANGYANNQRHSYSSTFEGLNSANKNADEAQRIVNSNSTAQMCSSMYDKLIQPDQLSLARRNSITAVKRRSWLSDANNDNILRLITEEQRKGRSHISFSDLNSPRRASTSEVQKETVSQKQHEQEEPATSSHTKSTQQNEGDKFNDKILQTPTKEMEVKTELDSFSSESKQKELTKYEVDQLDIPIIPERAAIIKTDPKAVENTIKTEPTTSRATDKTSLLTRSHDGRGVLSPRSKFLASQNCDLFNKEFSQAESKACKKLAEESPISTSEEEVETDEDEEEDQLSVFYQNNLNSRTVSIVNEDSNNLVTKTANINGSVGVVCDDSSSEEVTDEESEDSGDVEERLTLTMDADGVIIEPVETSSPVDKSSADMLNRQIIKLLNTLEEPKQFLGFGELGTIDINQWGGKVITDDDSSSHTTEDFNFDEESFRPVQGLKGIIAKSDKAKKEERVTFDRVVLFHDMAYEGQFDDLVRLASTIPDISVPNAQGITALHFAVCAGIHNVVKFLIENDADVNVQDQDGWSPLHCAASCNNLLMARHLVENGSCPFAMSDKFKFPSGCFESSLDCQYGINYMELVEESMGVVNDGKVYAAYSYTAAMDDELNFEDGDELRVIRKCEQVDDESADLTREGTDWWFCEHVKNGTKGLVPRNYFGLFPKRKYQNRYNLNNIHFENDAQVFLELKKLEEEFDDSSSNGPPKSSIVELSTYA